MGLLGGPVDAGEKQGQSNRVINGLFDMVTSRDPQNMAATAEILEKHKGLDFVQRILQGPDQPLFIQNNDGSRSTHLMMNSGVDGGKGLVYPTIVNTVGGLRQLSAEEAYQYAVKSGEFIEFPSEDEALNFAAGGYKSGWSR
jgi:hypothetical protein